MPFSRPFLALPPPSLSRVPKVILLKKEVEGLFLWMFFTYWSPFSGASHTVGELCIPASEGADGEPRAGWSLGTPAHR